LNNDRVYSYNLIATERSIIDGITIPAGATIVGRYEPAPGGLRYVANAVVFGDRSYRISAVSETIEDVKDPRDTSAGAIAEDAAIGAAGGAIIGEIFGGIDVEEIIGGAVAGGYVRNPNSTERRNSILFVFVEGDRCDLSSPSFLLTTVRNCQDIFHLSSSIV
jgi:hypothetical protein